MAWRPCIIDPMKTMHLDSKWAVVSGCQPCQTFREKRKAAFSMIGIITELTANQSPYFFIQMHGLLFEARIHV